MAVNITRLNDLLRSSRADQHVPESAIGAKLMNRDGNQYELHVLINLDLLPDWPADDGVPKTLLTRLRCYRNTVNVVMMDAKGMIT